MRYLDLTPRTGLAAAALVALFTILATLTGAMALAAQRVSETYGRDLPYGISGQLTTNRVFLAWLVSLGVVVWTVYRNEPDQGFFRTWWVVGLLLLTWVFAILICVSDMVFRGITSLT